MRSSRPRGRTRTPPTPPSQARLQGPLGRSPQLSGVTGLDRASKTTKRHRPGVCSSPKRQRESNVHRRMRGPGGPSHVDPGGPSRGVWKAEATVSPGSGPGARGAPTAYATSSPAACSLRGEWGCSFSE